MAHLGFKLFSVLLTEEQGHIRLRKPIASICEKTTRGSPGCTTGWCWGSGVWWWSGRGTGRVSGFGEPLGQEQGGQVCATLYVQPCLSPAPTPYLSAT